MHQTTYKSYREYVLNIENATFTFFTDKGAMSDCIDSNPTSHFHEFCELFFVTKGQIEINAEGKTYILKENDAALIPMYLSHNTRAIANSRRIVISFICSKNKSEGNYYSRFKSLTQGSIIILKNFAGAEAYRRFARYYYGNLKEKNQLIISCLHEIIALTKEFAAERDNIENNFLPDSVLYRSYIITDYLETRFADGSLKELSEILHLSTQQTNRIIKSIYKKTFAHCIMDAKMRNAAQFIANTDLPFAEISGILGYKSVHSFFTAFKKYNGVTPGNFKKSINT